MFALISPNELRGQFQRIAELADAIFDVAEPMHWIAAPDGTTTDGHAYDPTIKAIIAYTPEQEPEAIPHGSDDAGYPVAGMTEPYVVTKDDLAISIDDAVAAIYARYNRFHAEYTEREAQAQAYKDAGYTGDVPVQVAAFAGPAGKTGQQAADIILSQAAQLRGALSQLGVLRMRKYEVLMCTSVTDAQTKAATILAAVQQIGDAL